MTIQTSSRIQGRFTQTMYTLSQWIFHKKTFEYHAPDYVVVGMTRKMYDKIFTLKRKKPIQLFFDELDDIPSSQHSITGEGK